MKVVMEKRLNLREYPLNKLKIMHQSWRDLLFLHWKIDPALIQETLPEGLFVDTFDGSAYISVIPFLLQDLHLPLIPPIPGFSNFVEINLRTYVNDKNGLPGVWFYSLHINSKLCAFIAKKVFGLPYHFAEIELKKSENTHIKYNLKDENSSLMEFNYQPDGNLYLAKPETLDFFLLERYVLFSLYANELYVGRVHHVPYPISKVNATYKAENLFTFNSFKHPSQKPDLINYSPGLNVDLFRFEKVY